MPEFSRLDIHEGWAEIVIERPDRRNSLIPPLAGEIRDHIEQLNRRRQYLRHRPPGRRRLLLLRYRPQGSAGRPPTTLGRAKMSGM